MSTQGNPLGLPYFYGTQAEQFSFYRIPKALFTQPEYSGLSTDAKLLYGMMLDRMQLSLKNGWVDEAGRAYIYYKLESIQNDMGCADKKATKLLVELESKYGLIERKRIGQGKPTRIYVRNFAGILRGGRIQTRQKHDSRLVESTIQDSSKVRWNNTELNNTDISETESINLSADGDDGMDGDDSTYGDDGSDCNDCSNGVGGTYGSDGTDEYIRCRDYFYTQLEFDALLSDYPYEHEMLHEILGLLVETVRSTRKSIRICGEEKPAQVVKGQLMKLNGEHIRYVMHCMSENTTKIRNIKQYLLAALYNAPMTISSYYGALVNHDLYGNSDT